MAKKRKPNFLIVLIDDATGRIMLHMARAETTRDALVVLRKWVKAHGVPVSIYADLPYATNLGWPAWVTGEEADPHLVPEAAWARVLSELAPLADLEAVVSHFDEEECGAKLAAARCTRSNWRARRCGD